MLPQAVVFISWAFGFAVAVLLHIMLGRPKSIGANIAFAILAGLVSSGASYAGFAARNFTLENSLHLVSVIHVGLASASIFFAFCPVKNGMKVERIKSLLGFAFPVNLLYSIFLTIPGEPIHVAVILAMVLGLFLGAAFLAFKKIFID